MAKFQNEAATLAYLVTEALPLVERENPQLGQRLESGLADLRKAMRPAPHGSTRVGGRAEH